MRTTVTLEDDVAKLIDEERKRSSASLKDVINAALRRGLSQIRTPQMRKPFKTQPMDLGQPLMNLENIGEVLALLDEEDFRDSLRR